MKGLITRNTHTLRFCFLSSLVEFCSAVSEEKSKMSQPIRGQDGHLFFYLFIYFFYLFIFFLYFLLIPKQNLFGRAGWVNPSSLPYKRNVCLNFFFRKTRKTQTWKKMLRSCLLSSFVEFHFAVSEKSKMSQPMKGQGGHLVFLISLKNINLVEDVEILLPLKFR